MIETDSRERDVDEFRFSFTSSREAAMSKERLFAPSVRPSVPLSSVIVLKPSMILPSRALHL